MSKKKIDEDAYDVSPAVKKAAIKLLDDLTKDLESGARSIDKRCRFGSDALGTFRRRYRLSLQRVISDPATAKSNHRSVLGPAMKAHGRLAGTIAAFHKSGTGPIEIDRDAFLKAAHVIEIECKAFAVRGAALRLGKPTHAVTTIEVSNLIYCW